MLKLLFFPLFAAVAGLTAAHSYEGEAVFSTILHYREIDDASLSTSPESVLPRHTSSLPSSLLTRRGSSPPPKGAPSASGKQSKSPSPEPREQGTRSGGSKSPTPQAQVQIKKQGQRASSVKSSRPPSPAPPRRSKTRPYATNAISPKLIKWQSRKARTGVKPSTQQEEKPTKTKQPLKTLNSLEKFQPELAKDKLKRLRPEDAVTTDAATKKAKTAKSMLPPPPRKPKAGTSLSEGPLDGKSLATSATEMSSPGKQAPSRAQSTAASNSGIAKPGNNKKSGDYDLPAPKTNINELRPIGRSSADGGLSAKQAQTAASAVGPGKATENKNRKLYHWPSPYTVPNAPELFADAKPPEEVLGKERWKQIERIGKSKKDPGQ